MVGVVDVPFNRFISILRGKHREPPLPYVAFPSSKEKGHPCGLDARVLVSGERMVLIHQIYILPVMRHEILTVQLDREIG